MRSDTAQHWLSRLGVIVGLAAALFTLNALAFDSEVDRKISHAQQLTMQHNGTILHHVALLSQRQLLEGLQSQVRLEEFIQSWYAAELQRESDSGRIYELKRLSETSQKRTLRLMERLRDARQRLDELEATTPAPCCRSPQATSVFIPKQSGGLKASRAALRAPWTLRWIYLPYPSMRTC